MAHAVAVSSPACGVLVRRSGVLRWAGWSGLAMLAAILVNGPLASVRGVPESWAPGASATVGRCLGDPDNLRLAVIFVFTSTWIVVFGIPFFARLREVTRGFFLPTFVWTALAGVALARSGSGGE